MARVTFKKGDEYAVKLSRLGGATDEITKKAIYAGADVVANEMKKRLQDNINDPEYVGKKDDVFFKNMYTNPTGDLVESLGIASIQLDKEGNWNTKIGFDGYDSKGVPNQLKARAMESGTSRLKKRPFVRPAVNATRAKAIRKMKDVIDEETKSIMG